MGECWESNPGLQGEEVWYTAHPFHCRLSLQVNKQGMADRVVDDSNPEARLSSKEIQKLICDDENDPPPNSWDLDQALEHLAYADPG